MFRLDSAAFFARERKRQRSLEGYRSERCPECGDPITYFESTDFEGPDTVTQRFRCEAGHVFFAMFRLADVVPSSDEPG